MGLALNRPKRLFEKAAHAGYRLLRLRHRLRAAAKHVRLKGEASAARVLCVVNIRAEFRN